MSNTQTNRWLAAGILILWAASIATAEDWHQNAPDKFRHLQPFGPLDVEHDAQLFAPPDLGSYGNRPDPNQGLFATYERLHWNMSVPDIMSVGVDEPLYTSIVIYRDAPDFETQVPAGTSTPVFVGPAPPILLNGVDASAPDAPFGWGNRYEVGYMDGQDGWLLSYLELDQDQTHPYGFVDMVDTGEVDEDDNPILVPGNPYGRVAIIFRNPEFMRGFIDVETPLAPRLPEDDEEGAVDSQIGFPDGFADDVNDNGVFGPDGIDTDGDGVPDTLSPTDFDDLVTFLPTFQFVKVRNKTQLHGVELMKMHRFNPLHNGTNFEIYYGARFFQFEDLFTVEGTGGTLGDSNWDTTAQNNIIGPQIAARWYGTQGRWTISTEGRFLAGGNVQNLKQIGDLGRSLMPSELNNPLYFNPTSFRHTRRDATFSPVAELRLEVTYRLAKSVALKAGYTGIFADGIARASNVVDYSFPNMGLLDPGSEDIFSNGVNFGVEINR